MSSFEFKQFVIEQDRCAMKVGTDGVLLGAWAEIGPTCRRVLDIGTGTGLIALMIAQRLSEQDERMQPASVSETSCNNFPSIDAIEIDAEAAAQAQQNVARSPWPQSVHVFPVSLAQAEPLLSDEPYDLIISNPPFYNATLKPDDDARARARHKDSLPVSEIMVFARQHLSESGRLALIYPTDYDTEVMTAAVLSGLAPVRLCDVLTKEGKPAKRRMAEITKGGSHCIQRNTLAIRGTEGLYTEDYRQLTAPFYLRLSDG